MIMKALSGYKTHLTCLAIFALLFGSWQEWWTLPAEIYAALMALALMFLRSGVAKAEQSKETTKVTQL